MHDGEQSSSFRYQTQQPPPHRRVENKYRSNKESHHQQPSSISGLAATPCVFSLIEATTAALVVKKKPFVNGSVVRHREALRFVGTILLFEVMCVHVYDIIDSSTTCVFCDLVI